MKKKMKITLLYLSLPIVSAHTSGNTPGLKIHHLPTVYWILLGMVFVVLIYLIYSKTHDKPINPLKW